jgi:hypothetical protein
MTEPARRIRGLSVRQPWPWAILHAGKRIENRESCVWHRYRGEILLHASQSMTWMEHLEAVRFIAKASGRPLFPTYDQFQGRGQLTLEGWLPCRDWGDATRMGGIVGRARIVDAIMPGGKTYDGKPHPLAKDPWYVGGFGIVLDDVRKTEFAACKGALGLWEVPDGLLRDLKDWEV